ncbi:MAG: hydrolase [Flavobacteriales bacterium]|nr:hydrolase [Flavobacteriales bacterium]
MKPKKYKMTCPCCGYICRSDSPKGHFNTCEICFWEDDPIQSEDPNYSGGANDISLKDAQRNFNLFGACNKEFLKFVRPVNELDIRDPEWNYFKD